MRTLAFTLSEMGRSRKANSTCITPWSTQSGDCLLLITYRIKLFAFKRENSRDNVCIYSHPEFSRITQVSVLLTGLKSHLDNQCLYRSVSFLPVCPQNEEQCVQLVRVQGWRPSYSSQSPCFSFSLSSYLSFFSLPPCQNT